MRKNLTLLVKLLNNFNYKISKKEIKQRLFSDSESGIIPITNTLDFFGVKNIAANVPKTSFDQLPNYFIAQVSKNDRYNLVLIDKTKSKVLAISNDDKSAVLTKEEFLSHWTGLIIAIEENKELNTLKNNKKSNLAIGLILLLILLLTYSALLTQSFLKTTYLISSIIGLIFSYLITKEKLGFNQTPSRFCTISKDTDCNSVLNSKEAKILNLIDLGDASVIYFAFITLSSLYIVDSYFYFIASILSLPIVAYSIYNQYFKIKKWCPLCLGIALVLVSQFLVLFFSYKSFSYNYLSLLFLSIILGVVVLGWFQIKELLVLKLQNDSLVIENLTFRRNRKLFTPYYNSLTPINTSISEYNDIKIGSDNPIITILFITNPLCKMCKEAHLTYKKLIAKYPDELQVIIRFLVPSKNREDLKTQISECLLQLYIEEKPKNFNEALNEWYEKTNSTNWLKKWKRGKNNIYNAMLAKQVQWCLDNEILSTPSVLINQKLLPASYYTKDVEYFIEPLIEFEKKHKNFMHEKT